MKTVPAFPRNAVTLKRVTMGAKQQHPMRIIQGLILVSATHAVFQCHDAERVMVRITPEQAKDLGWVA